MLASRKTMREIESHFYEIEPQDEWRNVVKNTMQHFEGTPKGEFMTMVYKERQSIGRVCSQLYLDRNTYFRWREIILDYALIEAVSFGVLKVEEVI